MAYSHGRSHGRRDRRREGRGGKGEEGRGGEGRREERRGEEGRRGERRGEEGRGGGRRGEEGEEGGRGGRGEGEELQKARKADIARGLVEAEALHSMLAEHKTLGEKHEELSQLQAEQEKELSRTRMIRRNPLVKTVTSWPKSGKRSRGVCW